MTLLSIPDQFGYYQVGTIKTYSKLQAIELHRNTGVHPSWHFNDEVFSSYDWSQEPQESLDELYRQRAEQLRSRYDYLVLFFSGGADSTNVLHAFINNGIHIDELVCYHTKTCAGEHGVGEQEILKVALPMAQQAQLINPRIKIRELDITQDILRFYQAPVNRFDLVYDKNDILTPLHIGQVHLYDNVEDWNRLLDQGRSVGLIRGADKPRVFKQGNRYLVKFLDSLVNNSIDVHIASHAKNSVEHEFFYWSPDMPKLVGKQAHVIKNFLQTADQRSPYLTAKPSSWIGPIIDGQQYWLTEHGLHALIYPTWDINTFSMGKHNTPMASPRDSWFFTRPEFGKEFRIYQMSLQAIRQIAGEYWLNNTDQEVAGMKGMWSQSYYLN